MNNLKSDTSMGCIESELTDRQQRELDYHREHAMLHRTLLDREFSWDVLVRPERRWWNAYWAMYAHLCSCDLAGKSVLVVGCGFGDNALRLTKLGARVSAFDLSPDSLQIARALAQREDLQISLEEMPAERMHYGDSSFDFVVARDILHHVDVEATMREIVRVTKPGGIFVANEIYSHSLTNRIRNSWLVEQIVYPRMRRFIYGVGKPYITDDERKLTEKDLDIIFASLQRVRFRKYFNFFVTRVIPARVVSLAKMDRCLLAMTGPLGRLFAGRVLFSAKVSK